MRLAVIFLLALSIHVLYAQDTAAKAPSFAEKLRPTLINIIGEKWTQKLIGEAPVVPDQGVAHTSTSKTLRRLSFDCGV